MQTHDVTYGCLLSHPYEGTGSRPPDNIHVIPSPNTLERSTSPTPLESQREVKKVRSCVDIDGQESMVVDADKVLSGTRRTDQTVPNGGTPSGRSDCFWS
ncbi:hypothetical protein V6N13_004945 [Hibiscus sabdariffa]|uniref:Uncharacterized protein n=1 Tax=Hibiscus sabdariffa TaxID=183260 RepID=A0ABR2S0V1_9ROSI